jgi:hypothetical protein
MDNNCTPLAVLVRGDKTEAAGPGGEITVGDARTIDLPNDTLFPG